MTIIGHLLMSIKHFLCHNQVTRCKRLIFIKVCVVFIFSRLKRLTKFAPNQGIKLENTNTCTIFEHKKTILCNRISYYQKTDPQTWFVYHCANLPPTFLHAAPLFLHFVEVNPVPFQQQPRDRNQPSKYR